MHQTLLEITDGIEQAGERLARAYQPKRLYALRVGIRRTRSILKQIGSYRSRRYRKVWGGFAAVTNDARDWDVFLISCRKLLAATEYAEFSRLNRERVQCSHDAVTAMLQSAHWRH